MQQPKFNLLTWKCPTVDYKNRKWFVGWSINTCQAAQSGRCEGRIQKVQCPLQDTENFHLTLLHKNQHVKFFQSLILQIFFQLSPIKTSLNYTTAKNARIFLKRRLNLCTFWHGEPFSSIYLFSGLSSYVAQQSDIFLNGFVKTFFETTVWRSIILFIVLFTACMSDTGG